MESRERRHHFQRAAIRRLELENAEPLLGRAESLEPFPSDVALAQAVATPSQAAELLVDWTRPGGLLLFPGSIPPAPAPEHPQIEVQECRTYRVPGGPERSLWIAERVR